MDCLILSLEGCHSAAGGYHHFGAKLTLFVGSADAGAAEYPLRPKIRVLGGLALDLLGFR